MFGLCCSNVAKWSCQLIKRKQVWPGCFALGAIAEEKKTRTGLYQVVLVISQICPLVSKKQQKSQKCWTLSNWHDTGSHIGPLLGLTHWFDFSAKKSLTVKGCMGNFPAIMDLLYSFKSLETVLCSYFFSFITQSDFPCILKRVWWKIKMGECVTKWG